MGKPSVVKAESQSKHSKFRDLAEGQCETAG